MTESTVRRRMVIVLVMVLLGFCGLGLRLYQLIILSADRYSNVRNQMYRGFRVLPAQRGRILDRDLEPLATDRASYSLYVSNVEDPDAFAADVGRVLHLTAEQRKALAARVPDEKGQVKRIARGITGEKYDELVEALESYIKQKAVRLDPEFPRFYPEGSLASNVVGFVGSDQKGRGGIEYQFEERLEGAREQVFVDVDARRRFMPDYDYTKEAGVRGADVILTIDSRIQHLVEKELEDVVEESGAVQAMAVVLDPSSGDILAMAARPSFNPNDFNEVGEFRRKCRPITDMFEPGSVVKPFIIAGALERGIVTPDREFYCEKGRYAIKSSSGRTLKILRDDIHRFEDLTVRDIIIRSSNIGTCKIAAEMGEEAVYEILTRFGFGSVTGVDLPAETAGILRPVRSWSALSMWALPFGQELSTNCLTIATAYAILANRGVRIQPHIVKGYRNPADGVVSYRELRPSRQILDPGIAETVVDMLVGVTEDPEGTGHDHCRIPGFQVAGKTGTAQVAGPSGKYEKGKRIASWAGFFPADDPRAVIYVMVDRPTKGKYGGEVAGPVFTAIAEGITRYRGVPPRDIEARVAALPEPTPDTTEPAVIIEATEQTPVHGVMPQLAGMSIREAYLTLLQAGFRARFDGKGWVISQEIPPGQRLTASHGGRVVLGAGPEDRSTGRVVASAPEGTEKND